MLSRSDCQLSVCSSNMQTETLRNSYKTKINNVDNKLICNSSMSFKYYVLKLQTFYIQFNLIRYILKFLLFHLYIFLGTLRLSFNQFSPCSSNLVSILPQSSLLSLASTRAEFRSGIPPRPRHTVSVSTTTTIRSNSHHSKLELYTKIV